MDDDDFAAHFIDDTAFNEAMRIARDKGKEIEYRRLRFGQGRTGRAIQAFHLGDYNNMNDTLTCMTEFAKAHGYHCDKYTHDIYLNDSRKKKKENAKTIMRVMVNETDKR